MFLSPCVISVSSLKRILHYVVLQITSCYYHYQDDLVVLHSILLSKTGRQGSFFFNESAVLPDWNINCGSSKIHFRHPKPCLSIPLWINLSSSLVKWQHELLLLNMLGQNRNPLPPQRGANFHPSVMSGDSGGPICNQKGALPVVVKAAISNCNTFSHESWHVVADMNVLHLFLFLFQFFSARAMFSWYTGVISYFEL